MGNIGIGMDAHQLPFLFEFTFRIPKSISNLLLEKRKYVIVAGGHSGAEQQNGSNPKSEFECTSHSERGGQEAVVDPQHRETPHTRREEATEKNRWCQDGDRVPTTPDEEQATRDRVDDNEEPKTSERPAKTVR